MLLSDLWPLDDGFERDPLSSRALGGVGEGASALCERATSGPAFMSQLLDAECVDIAEAGLDVGLEEWAEAPRRSRYFRTVGVRGAVKLVSVRIQPRVRDLGGSPVHPVRKEKFVGFE